MSSQTNLSAVGNQTHQGDAFNGANQLLKLDGSAHVPTANLTGIPDGLLGGNLEKTYVQIYSDPDGSANGSGIPWDGSLRWWRVCDGDGSDGRMLVLDVQAMAFGFTGGWQSGYQTVQRVLLWLPGNRYDGDSMDSTGNLQILASSGDGPLRCVVANRDYYWGDQYIEMQMTGGQTLPYLDTDGDGWPDSPDPSDYKSIQLVVYTAKSFGGLYTPDNMPATSGDLGNNVRAPRSIGAFYRPTEVTTGGGHYLGWDTPPFVSYNAAYNDTTTLPDLASTVGKAFLFKNIGTGTWTISRQGTDQLFTTAAVTSITLAPGASKWIFNDGAYWCVE